MSMVSALRMPVLVLALFLLPVFVPQFYDAVTAQWVYIGFGGGIAILLYSITRAAGGTADKVVYFHWLLLGFYALHQFEEHGIDMLGRSSYFMTYANNLGDLPVQLTTDNIFLVNVVVVWLGGLIAIWGGWRYLWTGLAFAGIVLVNALAHIGVAISESEYNPGLATAVVLFLPVFFFYGRMLIRQGRLGYTVLVYAFLWGVVAHLSLYYVLPFASSGGQEAYAALCAAAFIPLAANLIYNRFLRRRAAPAPAY